MQCVMLNCNNEALEGRSSCAECLKPFIKNGVKINPPDISERTHQEMSNFFNNALRNNRLTNND